MVRPPKFVGISPTPGDVYVIPAFVASVFDCGDSRAIVMSNGIGYHVAEPLEEVINKLFVPPAVYVDLRDDWACKCGRGNSASRTHCDCGLRRP